MTSSTDWKRPESIAPLTIRRTSGFWISGEIPELPCIRNAERKEAVNNGSPTDPKQAVREWRESAWAVVRALMPFPEAKKAVIEALAAFKLGTPKAACLRSRPEFYTPAASPLDWSGSSTRQ